MYVPFEEVAAGERYTWRRTQVRDGSAKSLIDWYAISGQARELGMEWKTEIRIGLTGCDHRVIEMS